MFATMVLIGESAHFPKIKEPFNYWYAHKKRDKYAESPVIPLEKYLCKIKKLSEKTGIKTVFLATDSDEVIEAIEVIRSLSTGLRIEFIWDKEELRYDNANHKFVRDNPQLKRQETLTAIKVLGLLEACDYMIG